ncbi:hypothetical protein IJT93_09425 [bacterium]|nr:hypothetical protein [bacterium]
MFLLDKLFSADLQRFGAIFSAGLGLALGGMLSDALVMLLDGRSVVTYLSTTFFDIYSYTNFNLSTLCIFFGTVILVFGLLFADSAEEAAGECGMNEEPFELAEIK